MNTFERGNGVSQLGLLAEREESRKPKHRIVLKTTRAHIFPENFGFLNAEKRFSWKIVVEYSEYTNGLDSETSFPSLNISLQIFSSTTSRGVCKPRASIYLSIFC